MVLENELSQFAVSFVWHALKIWVLYSMFFLGYMEAFFNNPINWLLMKES